jgi:hypothetical protein
MLLYLNADTAEAWPQLQADVEATLRERGPAALLLLHEQREGRHAVSFDAIIQRTPTRLKELGVYLPRSFRTRAPSLSASSCRSAFPTRQVPRRGAAAARELARHGARTAAPRMGIASSRAPSAYGRPRCCLRPTEGDHHVPPARRTST